LIKVIHLCYDQIEMQKGIQPGLISVFRYFSGIAVIYYAVIFTYFVMQTGDLITSSQIISYVNMATNLFLFGYLSLPWLQRKLKQFYLPLALSIVTFPLILSNMMLWPPQQTYDASMAILRSWSLFPFLFVPLVLIAWQYNFRAVFIFVVATSIVDFSLILAFMQTINLDTITILGVPIIRGVSLGIVGHIVSQLIETQDAQKRQLIKANLKLGKYANTLEELATSRERNRLARELHDTLAHTLTGVAVNLEATKLLIDPQQTELLSMLDDSLTNVRTGLTETRRALRDLRAKQLDDLGLKLALYNMAHEASARADFQLKLSIQDDLSDLSPAAEQTVYRITQEALENIVKHAEAKLVSLSLFKTDGELQLVIEDDGKGFNANVLEQDDKFGIKGIQERAAMLNGKLDWQSNPQQGTVIRFSVEV